MANGYRLMIMTYDEKIKKAEERVIRTGGIYNSACEELKELRNKKAAIESEILVDAFLKSNKTLEEALAFFRSDMKTDKEDAKPKRRGRRKKPVGEGELP